MILADTDILSALAKVTRLPLLFSLLQATSLQIAPAVFREEEPPRGSASPALRHALRTRGVIARLQDLTPLSAFERCAPLDQTAYSRCRLG
jgi:hypothetical protein